LPDVEESQYLLDALFEIGLSKMAGDRLTSIDWQDIMAWVNVTGSNLTPGESVVIRHLSAVYVDQHYASLDSGCMSPHLAAPQNKVVIANKMKSLFAMLRVHKDER